MNTHRRLWLETSILTLLALRPSLDLFTRVQIPLGPIALNPAGIVSLALIALGAVWVLSLSSDERTDLIRLPTIKIYGLWLLILLPWVALPMLIPEARLEGVREWVRLLSILPLVTLCGSLAQRGEGHKAVAAIIFSFAFPALLGSYQVLFQQGLLVRGVHRINGTFVHPNPFSFYLVAIIGLTSWLWRREPRYWLWPILLAVGLFLLVSTYSFTGAVMLAVFIGVCALDVSARLRWVALTVLALFIAVFLLSPSGRDRIREITQVDQLDYIERTGKETSSFTWRLLNWRYLYRQWKKSPWIGYGLDSSTRINPNYNQYEGTGHQPHNDYVRWLVETGIVGLALTLAIMTAVGVLLWRRAFLAAEDEARWLAWCGMGLYTAWLVGSGNDNLSIATGYQYILWSIFALATEWRGSQVSS